MIPTEKVHDKPLQEQIARRAARSPQTEQKLAKARQAHAAGAIDTEDFIWTVMQCYAAESKAHAC